MTSGGMDWISQESKNSKSMEPSGNEFVSITIAIRSQERGITKDVGFPKKVTSVKS